MTLRRRLALIVTSASVVATAVALAPPAAAADAPLVIAPGGRTPFEAQPQADYPHVEATAGAMDTGAAFNHAFAVSQVGDFRDPATSQRMFAIEVRNTNSGSAADVTLTVTFYKPNGDVAGAETFGVGTLAAGAVGRVEAPVNSEFPDVATWQAVAESPTPPSSAGDEPPAAAGSTNDKPTTLNCNPVMTLSKTTVNVGGTTSVSVSGATPGAKLLLEGYSRPSTQYAPIRTEVTIGADGTTAPFAVRPPTSARVRLSVTGCSTPGTGQVISVIPGLGVSVTRVRTRTYTFAGKILPSKQNTGRAIGLYVGGVKKLTVKSAADGSYKATLTLPRGATKAWWATGADMTNLAGKSAVKSFTSY
ncbi:MAG: hypothetical protein LC779_04520 [Actinobacteria bacterium]|nr:hypothetical protein [Actinomycetota bacterium]